MLSSRDPYKLNAAIIVPKENNNARNFLFLNSSLIYSEYFVLFRSEQGLAGVGGLSLNHSKTIVRGIRLIKNYKKRRAVN